MAWVGGEKMEEYLQKLQINLADAKQVRVGFLEGSTEDDGTSLPMVAAIQNFGAPAAGIPPRPFFTNAIKAHKNEWSGNLGELLKRDNYSAGHALAGVGEIIKGDIQQSIVDTMGPPLSPVTLMLRQMRKDNPALVVTGATVAEARERIAAGEVPKSVSTKPLVDTGTMLKNVGVEVS